MFWGFLTKRKLSIYSKTNNFDEEFLDCDILKESNHVYKNRLILYYIINRYKLTYILTIELQRFKDQANALQRVYKHEASWDICPFDFMFKNNFF